MHPVRTTLLILVAFIIWPCAGTTDDACPINLTLDASHSRLLFQIIEDGVVSEIEIGAFMSSERTADILRKTHSMGISAGPEELERQIRMLAAGEQITDRSFALGRYAQNIEGTRALLDDFAQQLPEITARICAQMAPYLPAGQTFDQTVYLVSAVNSTGFTFGKGALYLVTEAFDGDVGAVGDLIVHESYHAVQASIAAEAPFLNSLTELPVGVRHALRFLTATLEEGSATHLADPVSAGEDGPMRAFQYRLAMRYRRDMVRNFHLFDTVLFRAYYDETAEYDELHRIGLEGNEHFYHVGALITKAIAEVDGPASIPAYFSGNPAAFFLRYVELASKDDALPPLSTSTVAILNALHELDTASN